MPAEHDDSLKPPIALPPRDDDEGGLLAPPGLTGWRKVWWWFDFIILVKLARLRFIAILVVIGVVITQWDWLLANYDKWTRPTDGPTAGAASDVEYFCPMHPPIIRSEPGQKCPICFMPLSKRKKGSAEAEVLPAGVVSRVQLSPYRVVLAGVQTWPVDYHALTKELSAVGYVEFNERGQRTVAARVKGRIEKLVVNVTGQMVREGDELALLYSPDLVVTVRNLLDAQRSGNPDLLNAARIRLERWGIDDQQLDEILARGTADTDLKIRSPISGHVITKYVREGQYVEEGMPLYELADLSTVWIQAQIYEDDVALLPVNHEGEVEADDPAGEIDVTAVTRAFPEEEFHGKLAFIYPHVDQETRTVTVRFELDNPDHKLRPGSTATVKLEVKPRDLALFTSHKGDRQFREMLDKGLLLAVPESSIIDTGSQCIVYRERTPGVYEGVEVAVGPRMAGPDGVPFYPVLRGLKQGDRVVASGSFLVDAETRLNPAAGSIYFGGSGGSQERASSVTTVRPSTPEDPDATIEAALASLSPEDRRLAETQRFCPVLPDNRLGSMGPPIKVMIEGRPVFLCCSSCKEKALANPQATLESLDNLQRDDDEAAPMDDMPETPPPPAAADDAVDEEAIQGALDELAPEDRKLAEAQRYCAVLDGSRLGSMGSPIKLFIDGQPVFICCEGCREKAIADPQATLERAKHLAAGHGWPEPELRP
jgi:membrane fusion protein, copper/silver efflux system